MIDIHKSARLSVISVVLMSSISAFHHIFRLGLGSLPLWMPTIMAPIGLAVMYKRSRFRNKWLLGGYALVAYLLIGWFGIMDGGLDHTLRVLGLRHFTFLPGGDAEFVQTAFQIGTVETSHWFFQITGSLVFVVSLFALFYTTRFLLSRLAYDEGVKNRSKNRHKPVSAPQGD